MRVKVNGQEQDLPEGTTVAGLLERMAVRPERVVVEVNLEVVPRERLAERRLEEGDRVEIVAFMAGG